MTLRLPLSLSTLRGLYITLLPARSFIGVFKTRVATHGYASFGLWFATVQYLP